MEPLVGEAMLVKDKIVKLFPCCSHLYSKVKIE